MLRRLVGALAVVVVGLVPVVGFAQASPASTAFVSAAYQVVLHRPADASAAAFIAQLDSHALTPTQLVQTLLASAEFRADEVNALEQNFLKRGAAGAGLNTLVGLLSSGTAAQVAAVIAASPEYYSDAGGTNVGFLQKIYPDALGRALDAQGATLYQSAFAQGTTRRQVATTILQSTEAANHLLLVLYQNAMQRSGTPNGSTLLAAALSAIAAMLPTPAPATPSPNVAFVNAAFEVVLHRPADPSAAQFVTLLNAGGMTQTQLVQTLVNSAEFRTAEVNALDQNFLKHGADAAGLNAFLGMLGSGTAAQVAAVIAASPEYYRAAGSTNTGFLEKLFLDASAGRSTPRAKRRSCFNFGKARRARRLRRPSCKAPRARAGSCSSSTKPRCNGAGRRTARRSCWRR